MYNNLSLSHDIDPDSNFFSDVFNCDIYILGLLNEILHDNNAPTKGLSCLHLNMRSLGQNFNSLTNFYLFQSIIKFQLLAFLKLGYEIHCMPLTWMDTT